MLSNNLDKAEKAVTDVEFINITFRPEPKVATGGPQGVLKVQKEVLGENYRGITQQYHFTFTEKDFPSSFTYIMKKHNISYMPSLLFKADYFMQCVLSKKLCRNEKKKYVFICHDIGSAVGAYHAGYPFYLILHIQGSLVFESESFGETLSRVDKKLFNYYEELAFNHAEKVYFVSNGAKKTFLKTTSVDVTKSNISEIPLYNTITEFDIDIKSANEFLKNNKFGYLLDPVEREKYLVFVSIGDYSHNKGLDRCPHILNQIALQTQKKIVWLVFGSKHKTKIYDNLEKDKHNNKYNFEVLFNSKRLEHSLVMGVLAQADYFLMMHRISIFDFATLEAMKLNKNIILSNIGGNPEFNKENNIILIDGDTLLKEQLSLITNNELQNNLDVFNKYFSPQCFKEAYQYLYDEIIDENLKQATCPSSKFYFKNHYIRKLIGTYEITNKLKPFFYEKYKNDYIVKLKILRVTIFRKESQNNKYKISSIFGFPLFKKVKSSQKQTIDILGIRVFKKRITAGHDKYYFFGIQIFSKKKLPLPQKNYTKELQEISKSVRDVSTLLKAQTIHQEIFTQYKNKYTDKDITIVACGKSLSDYTPILDSIHIGINRAYKKRNIEFDYLFAQDYFAEGMKEINEYDQEKCQKFYGQFSHHRINQIFHEVKPISEQDRVKANAFTYIIEDRVRGTFAQNLSVEPIGDFCGTVFSALQFALFTNPKRIFLVGCDCSEVSDSSINGDANYKYQVHSWELFRKHVQLYYPNLEVISINPVGLKGMFQDIYTNAIENTKNN